MIKYNKIVIGIDQSYKNFGVSIVADGKIRIIKAKNLESYKNNSEKRRALRKYLNGLLSSVSGQSKELICIIERIRLTSKGFLNIDYIKSIGALNALIVDCMYKYDVPVFSVDTRCWKATVVGTSKPKKNKFGVPEEKWPTVEWVIKKGFMQAILKKVNGRKTNGTFMQDGVKFMFDNDAADSCAIAMFGFVGDKEKLKIEK